MKIRSKRSKTRKEVFLSSCYYHAYLNIQELEFVIKNAEERISKWAANIYITRKEIARLKNDIYELDDEVAFLGQYR